MKTLTHAWELVQLLSSLRLLSPTLVRAANPQNYTLYCSKCKVIGGVSAVTGTVSAVTTGLSFFTAVSTAAEAASCVAMAAAFPPIAPAALALAGDFAAISAASFAAGVGSTLNAGISVALFF
jgi:hypothetical protein